LTLDKDSLKKHFEIKVNFKELKLEKILIEEVHSSPTPVFIDPIKLVDEFRKTSAWRFYRTLIKSKNLLFIFNKIFLLIINLKLS
jgi:hypothetical protein